MRILCLSNDFWRRGIETCQTAISHCGPFRCLHINITHHLIVVVGGIKHRSPLNSCRTYVCVGVYANVCASCVVLIATVIICLLMYVPFVIGNNSLRTRSLHGVNGLLASCLCMYVGAWWAVKEHIQQYSRQVNCRFSVQFLSPNSVGRTFNIWPFKWYPNCIFWGQCFLFGTVFFVQN